LNVPSHHFGWAATAALGRDKLPIGDVLMQPVPKTSAEALAVFRDPNSEDWERDYAALMITSLDEALPDLVATARDATVGEALQQRAAQCLAIAWADRGILMTADISGFTPSARQEILFQRGEGPPFRG
jgi:hypothetical protein